MKNLSIKYVTIITKIYLKKFNWLMNTAESRTKAEMD
jgi:hypothetical protein